MPHYLAVQPNVALPFSRLPPCEGTGEAATAAVAAGEGSGFGGAAAGGYDEDEGANVGEYDDGEEADSEADEM